MLPLMTFLMILLLLLGFPFMVTLLIPLVASIILFIPRFPMENIVQQIIGGIKPASLVCIPMFILAANIITSGKSAKKLIRLIQSYLGHIHGGLAITTNASCTIFGSVSGSTQATVAAIGGTMRPMLLDAGYSSSWSLALIINSSDIAFLIPPSIGFIVYGVATSTSVGKLFLSGVFPGILIFLLFSVYSYFYSRYKKIGVGPKCSRQERWIATKEGSPLLGFPVIVIGGIYFGILSPTEASAATVLYAIILEGIVYKTLTWELLRKALLSTGIVMAVVFILVGAGQAFSMVISFMRIPQMYLPKIFGLNPSALRVIIVINIAYFVACMFVDPIVAIYILSPIFQPYVLQAGVNPVLIGTLVTLQAAIGSATPPFGADIFTAQLIFRRPYLEIIRQTPPFIAILILVNILIIAFPDIALFLPNLSFGS